MGQYCEPIIIGAENAQDIKTVYSHNFDSGLKLMEHSWIGKKLY